MHIAIVGLMGSGKTTIGRMLATRLDRPFVDSDVDIEHTQGMNGQEISAARGIEALHDLEASQLLAALGNAEASVLAPAASVVDRTDCVEALRAPFVAWLDIPTHVLVERLRRDDHRRHLVEGELDVLRGRRAEAYRAVADVVVSDHLRTPEVIVAELCEAIHA